MSKKNYSIIILIVLVLTSMFILSACTARNMYPRQPAQPNTTGQGQNMIGPNMQGTTPGTTRPGAPDGRTQTAPVPTPAPTPAQTPTTQAPTTQTPATTLRLQQNKIAEYNRKADTIKSKLESMKEVDKASVIVVGDTALVGCKLSSSAKNVDTAKNMITKNIKDTDKTIKNVNITESIDLTAQVNRISEDIRNNKPIDEINASINKIMREISPKTP